MKTIATCDRSEIPQALRSADSVANLSPLECPIPETVRCVILGQDGPKILEEVAANAPPIGECDAVALREFLIAQANRIAIVAEPDCPTAAIVVEGLAATGQEHVVVTVGSRVDASSFMDEDDADEVAERLRQLGYL